MNSINRQSGLAVVEFAIVAAVLLTVIIGVIDISRLYFTVATLNEATRRGVRVAVVCPINDPAIQQAAAFNESGNSGPSPIIGGLLPQHFDVQYLNNTGGAVANPGGAGFLNIRYARVKLNGDFLLQTFIPGLQRVIPLPDFAATLPRESLGIPRVGTVQPC
jgi:Flp pilus assembly protein TadG